MKIHFDFVLGMMAVGIHYDKRLKTTFIFVPFTIIAIRLKKKQ